MNDLPPFQWLVAKGWVDNIGFSILASIAGFLGYHMRSVNDRRKVTWQRSLLETMASGFIGFLAVLVCKAMSVSLEWTGFIAGVLGWLGATASIQILESVLRKKLGLDNVDTATETSSRHSGESANRQHSARSDSDSGSTGTAG